MTELPKMNLFVTVPSNRDWKGKFGASFAGIYVHMMSKGVEGHQLMNIQMSALGQASCLNAARQRFIDEMLAGTATHGPYTHWLSLDDDMTFPLDLVSRLAVHKKDIVAINARHKTDEVKGSLVGFDDKYLSSVGKTGLEEVKSIGGAIFLACVDSFRNIPKPHFETRWVAEKNDYLSEDRFFAGLLYLHGVKMYCDHDTSKLVTHVGDYDYSWQNLDHKFHSNDMKITSSKAEETVQSETLYEGLHLIEKAAA